MSDPMPTKTATATDNTLIPEVTAGNTSMVVHQPMTLSEVGEVGEKERSQLALVTDKITNEAKTSDMDELGGLLTKTLMTAQGYDPDKLFNGGGIFGFLKGIKGKVKEASIKFDDVDSNVKKLVTEVDARIAKFRKRVQDLDELSQSIKVSYAEMGKKIEEITARADWMEQNIPEADPNVPFSAEKRQDWITVITFARQRADNLARARALAEMQIAQIGMMQKNSIALAQDFGEIKATTVPNMKTTFTLYVLNLEQKKGAEFSNTIKNTNDEILKRNAEMLGRNTTQINEALTRSNISIEALQANKDALLFSLQEVDRIRAETKQRLAAEAPQIEAMSRELATAMANTKGV